MTISKIFAFALFLFSLARGESGGDSGGNVIMSSDGDNNNKRRQKIRVPKGTYLYPLDLPPGSSCL